MHFCHLRLFQLQVGGLGFYIGGWSRTVNAIWIEECPVVDRFGIRIRTIRWFCRSGKVGKNYSKMFCSKGKLKKNIKAMC